MPKNKPKPVKGRDYDSMTGADAVAFGMRQINPDVVAAFPITPQTEIMERFSQFYADGIVDTEMILVESEHSAMSAVVGAAAAGARAMTATAANGLALMWEIVYIAASTRLPIVMNVVNRALSGPINIHCDHSDSMGCRDSGWIQIYSENGQEAYENTIFAVKFAEHPKVRLPVMVCQDGFITSHSVEPINFIHDDKVKQFIGKPKPEFSLLDVDNPITLGPLDLFDYYFEHKRQQIEGMENARKAFLDVAKEFEKTCGRRLQYFEEYSSKDADYVLVVMSSTAGTAKEVVDRLRKQGKKVGLIKPRLFRPFPYEEITKALEGKKAVAVMDRSASFGAQGGPLFLEISSAMLNSAKKPKLCNYIFGLGGRDTSMQDIEKVFEDLMNGKPKALNYLGVRG
ncbi:pyruvate ferredoxin oxidoreductase [Candidatus Woesearchaeota archaeon]|nr:pyruvate ferredoxin oxidoreductase [Candidatus Woesearchaeota archaeon]